MYIHYIILYDRAEEKMKKLQLVDQIACIYIYVHAWIHIRYTAVYSLVAR